MTVRRTDDPIAPPIMPGLMLESEMPDRIQPNPTQREIRQIAPVGELRFPLRGEIVEVPLNIDQTIAARQVLNSYGQTIWIFLVEFNSGQKAWIQPKQLDPMSGKWTWEVATNAISTG